MFITNEWMLRNYTGIIYRIKNKINLKVYIGQSNDSFYDRYGRNWWNYLDSKLLMEDIRIFGYEQFEVNLLEINQNQAKLNFFEDFYVEMYHSRDRRYGYNIKRGGGQRKPKGPEFEGMRAKMTLTLDEFLEKAKSIHGNKYDYLEVEYYNCDTKVTIKCNRCGEKFKQRPMNHFRSAGGCVSCNNKEANLRKTTKFTEFINRTIKEGRENFIYCEEEYGAFKKCKIKIKHTVCGKIFEQTPYNHFQSHGCPHCSIKLSRRYRVVNQRDLQTKKIIKTFDTVKEVNKYLNKLRGMHGIRISSKMSTTEEGYKINGGYLWEILTEKPQIYK